MNPTEPQLNPIFSDYATTDAYLQQLFNGPTSASAMDLKLARMKKHFAEDDRINAVLVTALGIMLLSAVTVLAACWPALVS